MLTRLLPLLLVSPLSFAATVQLGNTTLNGQDLPGLKQEFFGGIPFAEKPLGNLRFGPPVLKTSLDAPTFDASAFGPACLRVFGLGGNAIDRNSSEDCLTINVFRPAGIGADTRYPVMAWIYGGGFIDGSGSFYNGSTIISQSVERGTPVIYVNFNYRLGPLGFPQGSEAESKGALNLGLKDQLAALEWIQVNIGAFGGDKTKVTVFGESAGAISIGSLFLNSRLERLARAAIMQSGYAVSTPVMTSSARQQDWTHFVAAVPECSVFAPTSNTFSCMRNASMSSLLNAFATSMLESKSQFPWVPTIDGPRGIIPDSPSKLLAKGHFSKIPFITGANLDEGTLFVPIAVNSSRTIREWLITNQSASPADVPLLDAAATRILQLYPDDPALGSPYNTGNQTFGLGTQYKRMVSIIGDLLMHSLRRRWIQTASKQGVKAYGYLFNDARPAQVPPNLGVMHIMDIAYIYPGGRFSELIPGVELTAEAENLGRQMRDYWISFATSLDPNDGKGSSRPQWPQYASKNPQLLQLNSGNLTTIADTYRAEQIQFMISHSEILHH